MYDKFTQDNMYQILSQSVRFCRLYIKKTSWCVFSVHSVYIGGTFFRLTVFTPSERETLIETILLKLFAFRSCLSYLFLFTLRKHFFCKLREIWKILEGAYKSNPCYFWLLNNKVCTPTPSYIWKWQTYTILITTIPILRTRHASQYWMQAGCY